MKRKVSRVTIIRNQLKHLLVVVLTVSLILPSYTIAFAFNGTPSDISNHWAKETLLKAVNNRWLGGYGDGSIRPDNPITRAEFITVMNKVFNITVIHNESSFIDVNATDWFFNDVITAKVTGYISGDPDGKFRPNDSISRQEACSILGRYLEITDTYDEKYAKEFSDYKQMDSWAVPAIAAVREYIIMKVSLV